jgi:ABC-type nitrate/sulfonate/bicarbonate transport system substrate-binding protein
VIQQIRSVVMLSLLTRAAAGCANQNDKAKGLDVVRVSTRVAIANAPILIADEEGFFAREGIKLDFVTLSTSVTQSLPALEREKVDVLSGNLNIGFFNAIAKGARVRIVADRGYIDPNGCDFVGIVGRGSLFKSADPPPTQLRGRRISTNIAGASGYLAARYLASKGMTLSDVNVVTLPDNAQLQALTMGPWIWYSRQSRD